jgi:hypothetical protein
MKQINIFIAVCLTLMLSTQIFGVTDTLKTSGKVAYWTESVKGANDALGQKGYVFGTTTTSDTLKNVVSILVSQPFGVRASTELPGQIKGHSRNACSATTFMVGINVTTAYTGGAATLTVQGSGDGVNWTLVSTASANLSSVITATGTTWYLVDLKTTNIQLPYYRLVFNANAATVNRAGKMQMLYILPQ